MNQSGDTIDVAARKLGISQRKVRAIAKRGIGVLRKGSRGRGRETLIDTAVVAELLYRSSFADGPDRLVAWLGDALAEEFQCLVSVRGALRPFAVPDHQVRALVAYLTQRARDRLMLEIKNRSKRVISGDFAKVSATSKETERC